MYLTKIKLVNFMGIYVGQKCETLEIEMDNQYPLTLIRAQNGYGKAQPLSTRIPTSTGYTTMGHLKVGDYVFDKNGHPTRVIGIFDQGIKDVYEVIFDDGRKTRCCKEHLWTVFDSCESNIIRTIELSEIMDNYIIDGEYRYSVPLNGRVEFYSTKLPINPRMVGYGVMRRDALDGYMFSKLPTLADGLIPFQYLVSSIDDRRSLLYGILDGADYHIKDEYIIAREPKLIEQIRNLCAGIGMLYRHIDDDSIAIYNPIDIDTRTMSTEFDYTYSHHIVDIRYVGKDECRCILVDNPDHLYLCDDFIVTHNTVLLSALSSPFAYDGGMDNRSTIDIIRHGYLGEKEMTYVDGSDTYFIHHYYRPNQSGSHSVKSYICKNGVEMNPNGNVSSFEQIISGVFGIVDKDLMLLRLGTNATSFTSLSSMERKKYLSRIIGDIDIYMQMFSMIQYDIRVNRTMISNYSDEISKLKIGDIEETIKRNEKRRKRSEQLLIEIGRLDSEKKNIINDDTDVAALMAEKASIEQKMSFASAIDPTLKKISVDKLRENRRKIETDRNATQMRLNEIKSTIDSNNRSIEFAKIDLNNMMIDDSLSEKINSLQIEIDQLEKQYKKFKPKMSSKDYAVVYQNVNTILTLMTVVVGYENKIVDTMLDIYTNQMDIDQWVDKSLSTIVDPASKLTMSQHMKKLIGQGYQIPDCSDVNCVYRKIGEMINTTESDDDMTIDFIQSVRKALATFNRIMMVQNQVIASLPKQLQDLISTENLMQCIREGKIFPMEMFDNYRLMLYGYESYAQKKEQMHSYKEQESSKQRLIVVRGETEKRIRQLSESNSTLFTKLTAVTNELDKISTQLEEADVQIGKKLEYDAVKDMISSYTKRLSEIDKIMENQMMNRSRLSVIREKMDICNNELSELQQVISETDTAISLYEKYTSEIDRLNNLIAEQNKILRNVSVKEHGIPILYMKTFFDKIRLKCNELLDITYDGNLKIGEFDPSSAVFDIPYIKNGTKIKDVKFASQGEQPVINIALSFAMSSLLANKKYNILCCDELDSTLDYQKKLKYPETLNNHIATMGIDQCFVISHSEVFDTISTNIIDMSDSPEKVYGSNMYEIHRS